MRIVNYEERTRTRLYVHSQHQEIMKTYDNLDQRTRIGLYLYSQSQNHVDLRKSTPRKNEHHN